MDSQKNTTYYMLLGDIHEDYGKFPKYEKRRSHRVLEKA
jgi:hypothetical protein